MIWGLDIHDAKLYNGQVVHRIVAMAEQFLGFSVMFTISICFVSFGSMQLVLCSEWRIFIGRLLNLSLSIHVASAHCREAILFWSALDVSGIHNI